MNESCCYFHPKEAVVGVCALCLNERLTVLASKQEKAKFYHTKRNNNNPQKTSSYYSFFTQTKPHQPSRIHLPKLFALSSLLGRLDIGHGRRSEGDCQHGGASTSSPEDSFISIKFENNCAASWEKGGTVPMVSLDHCDMSWRRSSNTKEPNNAIKTGALVDHAKPRGSLRWRKRIGHVFQVIKLRRSTKSSNVCHVSAKLEGGVKVVRRGQGWIRTLTKRKTKE